MSEEKKLNCWEFHKCGRQPGGEKTQQYGVCPASINPDLDNLNHGDNAGRMCWMVENTLCDGDTRFGEIQGDYRDKYAICMNCPFFKKVKEEERENFNFSKL